LRGIFGLVMVTQDAIDDAVDKPRMLPDDVFECVFLAFTVVAVSLKIACPATICLGS